MVNTSPPLAGCPLAPRIITTNRILSDPSASCRAKIFHAVCRGAGWRVDRRLDARERRLVKATGFFPSSMPEGFKDCYRHIPEWWWDDHSPEAWLPACPETRALKHRELFVLLYVARMLAVKNKRTRFGFSGMSRKQILRAGMHKRNLPVLNRLRRAGLIESWIEDGIRQWRIPLLGSSGSGWPRRTPASL